MSSTLKRSWGQTWGKVQAGFRHAFATAPETVTLSAEDQALLDRIAEAIVNRRMAVPITVFLESLTPMNFVGSQALHVLAPLLEVVLDAKTLDQAARLLERRETIERLVRLIEAKSLAVTPSSSSLPTSFPPPVSSDVSQGTSVR